MTLTSGSAGLANRATRPGVSPAFVVSSLVLKHPIRPVGALASQDSRRSSEGGPSCKGFLPQSPEADGPPCSGA